MLRVDALGLRFRRHDGQTETVLDAVTLAFGPGELVGLVGGSGAGKSLVADALTGLLPRNAEMTGQITVEGRALRAGDVALAPQGIAALDPLARVGAQLDRMARLAGAPLQAPALASAVGLPVAALRAWPHELSGGMAKRALIATALATQAPYLVADEPTLPHGGNCPRAGFPRGRLARAFQPKIVGGPRLGAGVLTASGQDHSGADPVGDNAARSGAGLVAWCPAGRPARPCATCAAIAGTGR